MVFDSPQWPLRPPQEGADPTSAGIGRLQVFGPKQFDLTFVIPSQAFLFVRQIVKADMADVEFVLEQFGARWVFSMMHFGNCYDMWYYTASSLPHFVKVRL